MVLCTRCSKEPAVIKLRPKGESLCRECFIKYFEEKVLRALRYSDALSRMVGKLVIVATSGGKDSSNTLFIMKRLGEIYDFEVKALVINEGIQGYRELKLAALKKLCASLEVELVEIRLKDEMGITIDQVAKLHEEGKIDLKPCSVCGVYRRYLINKYAKEMGASFVATGHNLDDEIQTFIMNLLRGDLQSIVREGILSETRVEELVPRVKPLYYVYEKESMVYFLLNGLTTPYVECPYASLSMRYNIRTVLNQMEDLEPGLKERILLLKESLREKLRTKIPPPKVGKCSICGMPSSREVCRACQIRMKLEDLGLNK